ncbi:MAG: DUF4421 domain-containing protein [Bacteroidaceae bacterium]|jgi:hypothetical protein
MPNPHRLFLSLCLSLFPLLLMGEEKNGLFPEWVERLIGKFTKGSAIDTAYVTRDTFRFIVKPKLTGTLGEYTFKWKSEGNEISLGSSPQMKIGVNLTYRHLTLGLSTNVDQLLGRKSKKEIDYSLSSYGNRFGGELFYTTSDNYNLRNEQADARYPRLRCFESQRLQGSAYYVFNHRRFSYPCTITQSYYQRRSCGSFLIGANFSAQRLTMDEGKIPADLPPEFDGLEQIPRKTSYTIIGLSVGYAYNWVLKKRWTLHASLIATVPVYEKGTISYTDRKETIRYNPLNTSPAMRFGVLYNGRHNFGGLSISNNFQLIRHSSLHISDLYFRARLYYGMRF